MQFLLDIVAMPPNTTNPQSPAKQDPLDAIIRRYLAVNGVLNEEALEVVQRWYTYTNVLTNSIGNQLRQEKPIPIDLVEIAFETPVAGFQGNQFWQQYGHSILPLVQRDIVTNHVIMRMTKENADLVFALNVIGQHTFIGLVISLVQKDGLASWKAFEVEYRNLMVSSLKDYLKNGTPGNDW